MAQIILKADINRCEIEGWQTNTGEVNARVMNVEICEELCNCAKQFVTFELADGTVYESLVVDGKARIPTFEKPQFVEIGLYAADIEGDECIKRYSPKPTHASINNGGYKGDADIEPKPTPGDYAELLDEIENLKNTDGGSVVDLDILTEVDPAKEHTNEQLYGAKALDEMFLGLEEVLVEDIAKGLINTVSYPNVWELESGAYYVSGGFRVTSYDSNLPTVPVQVSECFMVVTEENYDNAGTKKFFAINGNKIYYGHSVLDGMDAETGEPLASGECDWYEKTETINEKSTSNEFPSAKAVYDVVKTKQDALVSGKNIKTINGESLLGSGNIPISGSSGGSTTTKVFEQIATVTVVPDENGNLPTKISITADDDGSPFELTDIYCEVLMGLTDGTAGRFCVQTDKLSLIGNAPLNFTNTALRKWFFRYDSFGEGLGGLVSAPNGSLSATSIFPSSNVNALFGQPVPVGTTLNIKSLNFVGQVGDTKTFMEGTTITLWGVRK